MRIIVLALLLSACAQRESCLSQARLAVPTYAESIGDMIAATEVEQACLRKQSNKAGR